MMTLDTGEVRVHQLKACELVLLASEDLPGAFAAIGQVPMVDAGKLLCATVEIGAGLLRLSDRAVAEAKQASVREILTGVIDALTRTTEMAD